MAKRGPLTPSVLVAKIRENQNNNKTLKSLFSSQFLGKFNAQELEGFKISINKELDRRKQVMVDEKIEYLKNLGYKVSK